jgi:hypothetical protein
MVGAACCSRSSQNRSASRTARDIFKKFLKALGKIITQGKAYHLHEEIRGQDCPMPHRQPVFKR